MRYRSEAYPAGISLLFGVFLYFYFNQFVTVSTAMLGYFLVLVVILAFLRYPYHALLAAFLTKPVIDMFWYTREKGFISPLFIAGVSVPIMAILMRKHLTGETVRSRHDPAVLAYLAAFGALTVFKILYSPHYLVNAVDSYARILYVTLFYFIGKYYFREDHQRRQLMWVIVLSTAVPFFLTLYQQLFGGELAAFKDVVKQGATSAFYIEGRHDLVRISGVYEGVYELAFYGAITSLLLTAVLLSEASMPAWSYPLLPLSIYFLYFTYSRSAWAMFFTALLLFLLLLGRKTLAVLLISSAGMLYAFIPNVRYRFEDEIGFLLGEKGFATVGYSRGGMWTQIVERFGKQETVHKLIGNYGLGNAENQFLGVTIWFGYIGLAVFLLLLIYLTVALLQKRRELPMDDSIDSNIQRMFLSMIVASYWFAGLGNHFITMISVQWILWTWTGILLSEPAEESTAQLSTGQDGTVEIENRAGAGPDAAEDASS
jgi:hypothetical protein